jgi:ABC-2 type transport system ATP-binding protein
VTLALSVRELALRYRRRLVLSGVSFDVRAGHCLGVLGANGAGKTTLLRSIVGCLTPAAGEIRIEGLLPRDALSRTGVAYFAGEATLPGFVRASGWGTLGTGDTITEDRRRLRALSRGTRQLVGLRTALGRHPLTLIVLDEPWEGLDVDGARWLTSTLEIKRDRGAAIVISSHRPDDLAGLCDAYLLLLPHQVVLVHSHELAPAGAVTATLLTQTIEHLRNATLRHRAESRPKVVAETIESLERP